MLNGIDHNPELPEPFVPADHDVTMLDGFRLNIERLLASELLAIGTPEQCWAALMLWCRAWKQTPGGSLPNNERILANFSGAGRRWAKVRAVALHGFTLCSDGRLYHRFLCEEVKRAFKARTVYEDRREADRKRLSQWREKRPGNAPETPIETRFVAEGTVTVREGNGKGREGKNSLPSVSIETSEREFCRAREPHATLVEGALSQEVVEIAEVLIAEAAEARSRATLPPANLRAEAAKFLLDPRATRTHAGWLRWALNARADLTQMPESEPGEIIHERPERRLTPQEIDQIYRRKQSEEAA